MKVSGEWLSRLVKDLRSEQTVLSFDATMNAYRIDAFEGRTTHLPVYLVADENEFIAHLDAIGVDGLDVFPDVDRRLAGYRLFLVHLDETLRFKVTQGARLRLSKGRLLVTPELGDHTPARPANAASDTSAHWSAERPG